MKRKRFKSHIKKILRYDPTSGIFYNRETEKVIGVIDVDGYVYIWIEKNKCRADELAWRYVTGVWPKHPLVHVDGVNSNNWFDNLKMVPVKKVPENNKSKVVGVYWCKKDNVWRAQISKNGKNKSCGSYKEFDLAVIARFKAEQLHGYDLDTTAHQYLKRMFL